MRGPGSVSICGWPGPGILPLRAVTETIMPFTGTTWTEEAPTQGTRGKWGVGRPQWTRRTTQQRKRHPSSPQAMRLRAWGDDQRRPGTTCSRGEVRRPAR